MAARAKRETFFSVDTIYNFRAQLLRTFKSKKNSQRSSEHVPLTWLASTLGDFRKIRTYFCCAVNVKSKIGYIYLQIIQKQYVFCLHVLCVNCAACAKAKACATVT
jgi:hypothetical protein